MMYSDHECISCKKPAVGFATNLVYRKYYCNKHFWAMGKRVDDWMKAQEEKQWHDQEWYQQIVNPQAKPKEPAQAALL